MDLEVCLNIFASVQSARFLTSLCDREVLNVPVKSWRMRGHRPLHSSGSVQQLLRRRDICRSDGCMLSRPMKSCASRS